MISVEGAETSPIYMNERPYSNPIYTTTTYPGVVSVQPFSITFNPNTGQPQTMPGQLAYYQLNPRSTRRLPGSSTRWHSWSRWASTRRSTSSSC